MNERSSYQFEQTFRLPESPGTEQIRLPEFVENDLEKKGGAVDSIVAEFVRLGIDEETIRRYRASVREFLRNRPSETRITQNLRFIPKLDYFGLHVEVPASFAIVERLCARWKPKLGQEGIKTVRLEGTEAFRLLREDWPSSPSDLSPAIAKFLTGLNRQQYALHDPIHIPQGLATGDRLNRYQERFDPDGTLFSKEGREAFVRYASTAFDAFAKEWSLDAPIPLTPASETPAGNAASARGIAVVFDNEATMDTLSERHLRPVLRQQPAACLWLHNRVTYLTTILREINRRVEQGRGDIPPEAAQIGQAATESLQFVAQNYFTAFDSTSEAEAYFREPKSELGRPLSGTVLSGPAMTRVDLECLTDETRARFQGKPTKTYRYPSGETRTYADEVWTLNDVHYANSPPISNRGVELAADVFEAAAERGASGKTVQDALYQLQHTLEREPVSDQELRRSVDRLNAATGTTFSVQDGRELFGISAYVSVRGFEPEVYAKAQTVRKAVYERLYPTHPERLKESVSDLFFDASSVPGPNDYYLLTGFGTPFQDPFSGMVAVDRLSWNEVKAKRSLGVTGIDMTKLPAVDAARVRELYERTATSPKGDLAELTAAMDLLRELKLKQKKV